MYSDVDCHDEHDYHGKFVFVIIVVIIIVVVIIIIVVVVVCNYYYDGHGHRHEHHRHEHGDEHGGSPWRGRWECSRLPVVGHDGCGSGGFGYCVSYVLCTYVVDRASYKGSQMAVSATVLEIDRIGRVSTYLP